LRRQTIECREFINTYFPGVKSNFFLLKRFFLNKIHFLLLTKFLNNFKQKILNQIHFLLLTKFLNNFKQKILNKIHFLYLTKFLNSFR